MTNSTNIQTLDDFLGLQKGQVVRILNKNVVKALTRAANKLEIPYDPATDGTKPAISEEQAENQHALLASCGYGQGDLGYFLVVGSQPNKDYPEESYLMLNLLIQPDGIPYFMHFNFGRCHRYQANPTNLDNQVLIAIPGDSKGIVGLVESYGQRKF
jgi:hypothetical protein